MDIDFNLERAILEMEQADALLIVAGAGIVKDSGLPDLRNPIDFNKAYPLIYESGLLFPDVANPLLFKENPRLAWAFYGHQLNLIRNTQPHKGFFKLQDVANKKKGGCFVFTSNVDGLFQKAGFDNEYINECQGSIHHIQCSTPCSSEITEASALKIMIDKETFLLKGSLPYCEKCGSIARPNILMYGDASWVHQRSIQQGDRLEQWLLDVEKKSHKMVILEIGAAKIDSIVRWTSQNVAKASNSTLIRINSVDYNVIGNNIALPLGAAEGIDEICSNL